MNASGSNSYPPDSWSSRLHSLTDLLQMLTILVAMQKDQEVYITREMAQDYADYQLYLESSYDTANVRLTCRRRHAMGSVKP